MDIIHTDKAPAAVGPYSQAMKTNGLIFCSGQVPIDPATGKLVEGGVDVQTRQAIANLKAVLEAAGSSLDKVLKTTVLIMDMAEFPVVNQAYAEAFGGHKPARACFQVAGLPLGALVEIECVAEA